MSSTLLNDFKDDIKGFETSTGTIRFTPEKPIPNDLITKIVMARLAENEAKQRRNEK